MTHTIRDSLLEAAALTQRVADELADDIAEVARFVTAYLEMGGTIAFCGNGGSAADAQHLAAELVGRFLLERPAYAAIAFTTDTSILTAVGNDYGFDEVFARQAEALLGQGDVLIAMSTSGNAANCVRAVRVASEKGVMTIGMTGERGGQLGEICDLCIRVPHESTPRIQEAHITIGHVVCELVEGDLADGKPRNDRP